MLHRINMEEKEMTPSSHLIGEQIAGFKYIYFF